MKTRRSSSISRVKISMKVSRVNIERIEKIHYSMKKVFAKFQSVKRVIFWRLRSFS